MNLESVIHYCYDHNIFIYSMMFFCIAGIIIQCGLLIRIYRNRKEIEHVFTKSGKFLQNFKSALFQTKDAQKESFNVDNFVNKYVNGLKGCGLLLSTWESIGGQILSICLLIGSCSGILGIIYGCVQNSILLTFLFGAWTAIIVNIVNNIVNISGRKKDLILNLMEYINNADYESKIVEKGDTIKTADEWNTIIPQSKKIEKQQKKLNHMKEEIRIQKQVLAKEIDDTVTREKESAKKAELVQKKKQENLNRKQLKKQAVLDRKQAKQQEHESRRIDHEVNSKLKKEQIQKAKAVLSEKIKNDARKEKQAKQEARIKKQILAEQEKEKKRLAKQSENEKQADEKKSRAYEEKMRLKREKERSNEVKESERPIKVVEVPPALSEPQKEQVQPDLDPESVPDEVSETESEAAISKEEEELLQKVLKDYFN